MKDTLKVGFEYVNRIGKTVKIISKDGSTFMGDDGIKYGLVGVAMEKGASWDLIEFADGFPLFTLKLPIPVEKINSGNNYNAYRHEEHEVVVKYIGKIPQGRRGHEASTKFDYRAHYVIPNEYKDGVKDYPYLSGVDGDLFTVYLKRQSVKFDPKKFVFNHQYIFAHDEKIAKATV